MSQVKDPYTGPGSVLWAGCFRRGRSPDHTAEQGRILHLKSNAIHTYITHYKYSPNKKSKVKQNLEWLTTAPQKLNELAELICL